MTELTRAITAHDLAGIIAIVEAHPEQIHQREYDWLPLEWAQRAGSPFTLARLIRVLAGRGGSVDCADVLRRCLIALALNYFGGGTPDQSARRAWDQIRRGVVSPFRKDHPDFVLDDDAKKDLAFLIVQCGIDSESGLVELVTRRS